MSKNPQFGGIFRGLNANYLVIDAEWLARDPDDVKHMLASLIRAVNWMRTSRQNLRQAVEWAIGAEERFTGKKSSVTPEQAMNITQRELLDIVSAPLIPAVDATNRGPLYKQLEFLKKLGKLPADATWEKLQNGVRSELMKEVFSKAGQYQLKTFDYEK
jgi:ABC-type nitrate/sulfonate/bicarbonate transport system substrate-binding protein